MTLQEYITIVNQRYQAGNATEHSYRGDLQQLLETLLTDVDITNEPKRIDCGAPDYIISRKGKDIPIGYIEAKDVGVELGAKAHKAQFDRYRSALDNLIITDYLQFHFYKESHLIESVYIGEIGNGKVHPKPENFDHFTALVQNFTLAVTQSIKSPTKLAVMMASKARLMANVIFQALEEDDKKEANSELQSQREAFKTILIHDIDNNQFSDIYAQTIAYGLFAARYHDPSLPTFSREEAARLIPHSNPFLRRLFQTVATYSLEDNVGQRLLWIVEELVQVFLATDVAKIMKNFGRSTRQQDPVVHFYETFLAEYDPKLRKARGVWYTPEPVVNFIVRAVDDILKTKFNLPQGLTDTRKTKIKIKTDKPDKRTSSGYVEIEKDLHKVQILDPATGTGTFLAKTIEHIYENNFASMQGMWPAYVKDNLIPRLNGFEILMTSYAMAHLKIDMLLSETGFKTEEASDRLRIYLTNSLEEHHPDTGTLFASWLSSEANEANHIKRDAPVMVVIGNPPYSVSSSNKSDWIQNLLKDYKKDLNERKINLDDDYIKFIRFGQHFIDKNGEGVLAYISNNSFIDGITHRQMRKNLLESFDEIYILDLHGNAKKKETAPDGGKDENVFDIMQGVSINLFVKTGKKPKDAFGKVFHHELYGKRENKYEALNTSGFKTLPWQELATEMQYKFFVPTNFDGSATYQKGFKVDDLMNGVSGIETKRDHFAIDFNLDDLKSRITDFVENDYSSVDRKSKFDLRDNEWIVDEAVKNLRLTHSWKQSFYPCLTRPFDTRWIVYSNIILSRDRGQMMAGMNRENLGIILGRQSKEDFATLITDSVCTHKIVTVYDRSFIFPLYNYLSTNDLLAETTRTPNLNADIVQKIALGLGLSFTPEKTDQSNTFAPIDLLDYIYAILHSPNYRETYKEFLKIDFPRVPYPQNTQTFWQLVALGSALRQTHLLKNVPTQSNIVYPIAGDNVVDKLRYEAGKVFINASQCFENVPEIAWNFNIGGYQPAQKWLKDRKARALNMDDVQHYQKIIYALVKTHELMTEIDKVNVNN